MITPTPFQRAVLQVPEPWNVALLGGRGGGKSTAMQLLTLRHVEKYERKARPLIIRASYKGLEEIEEELDGLFVAAYGSRGVRHNRSDHTIKLANRALVELGQLEKPGDYSKYQGRSFTLLEIDEAGLLRDYRWSALLKSNLRATPGLPLRTVIGANPGGPQHQKLHSDHIAKNLPFKPYDLDDETWVTCNSTFADNPHLDHANYERKLRAACGNDEALARAWIHGDWDIARGAFFGGCLDERVHMLPVKWPHRVTKAWRPFLSMDWGSSAPSVVYLCLRAPGDVGPWPRKSLLLVDEVATYDPRDLNQGLNYPPGKLAECVQEMCARHGVKNMHGVGDDARGLNDETLLDIFRDYKIYLQKPTKSRVGGWAKMKEMLANAALGNGKPGLYVSARCKYFWQTLPFLPRDPSRPEDLDSDCADHAADAARYACLFLGNEIKQGHVIGMF